MQFWKRAVHGLRELQKRCYDVFVGGDEQRLEGLILGADPASGIAIYQNNALETFTKTLTATYPVISRLVGPACFRTLSRDYMRERPSTSGNLARFGAAFPEFLDAIYRDGRFDYLMDVARLEWACEEAAVAADATRLDLTALSQVPESALPELRLSLHPSCRLIASIYPILTIWRANLDERDEDIPLDRSERVLVARSSDVELHPLSREFARFIGALLEGSTLAHACQLAELDVAGFDPAPVLTWLARQGLLVEPPLNLPHLTEDSTHATRHVR